jgi:hypothetical protein
VLAIDQPTRIPVGAIPGDGMLEAPLSLPAVGPRGARAILVQSEVQGSSRLDLGAARLVLVLGEDWLPARTQRFYVDGAAPANGDGRSWSTAFRDLRNALDAAPGSLRRRRISGSGKEPTARSRTRRWRSNRSS